MTVLREAFERYDTAPKPPRRTSEIVAALRAHLERVVARLNAARDRRNPR